MSCKKSLILCFLRELEIQASLIRRPPCHELQVLSTRSLKDVHKVGAVPLEKEDQLYHRGQKQTAASFISSGSVFQIKLQKAKCKGRCVGDLIRFSRQLPHRTTEYMHQGQTNIKLQPLSTSRCPEKLMVTFWQYPDCKHL